MKRILAALIVATTLSGGPGSNQPQIVTRPIRPPDALLTCRVSSPVPRDAETQREFERTERQTDSSNGVRCLTLRKFARRFPCQSGRTLLRETTSWSLT